MSIIEKIYNIFDYQIEEPPLYGAFHIVSLVLIAITTFIICKTCLNRGEKSERRLALICWLVIVALEIYKQLNFSISFENGELIWDYEWYAFPFQFCSSPIYTLPLVAFLPNGKIREAAVAFLGTFSLFAGLAVCIYPGDVYIDTLGICIQTMVHHGLQVVLGIFFTMKRFSGEKHPKKRTYMLSATTVFASLTIIAMIMNIAVQNALTAAEIDETFNMFYISPYHECTLPVLSIIYPLIPYPIFLCIYIFGFAFVGWLVSVIELGIIKLVKHIGGKSSACKKCVC